MQMFTLEKRCGLPNCPPPRLGFTILFLFAWFLGACSSHEQIIPTLIPETPTATATKGLTSTATNSPTPMPVDMEQFTDIDPALGSITMNEDGTTTYYSAANIIENGKNIEVSGHYVKNIDGSRSIWITPTDDPESPLFIKDSNSPEIVPVKGYVNLNQRFEVNDAVVEFLSQKIPGIESGQEFGLGLMQYETAESGRVYYTISGIITETTSKGEDGFTKFQMAVPTDGNSESSMIHVDVIIADDNVNHDQQYVFLRDLGSPSLGGGSLAGNAADGRSGADYLSKRFVVGNQIIISGQIVASDSSVAATKDFALHSFQLFKMAFEHADAEQLLLDALRSGEMPLLSAEGLKFEIWGPLSVFLDSR